MLAQVQWGDVASWAAAVFTGAAFATALALLVLQRRDLNDLRGEKRRDQARLISAWPTALSVQDDKSPTILEFGYGNASDEPAYAFAAGSRDTRTKDSYIWQVVGTLPPGVKGTSGVTLPLHPAYNLRPDDVGLVSRFRDAAGRLWFRDASGVLTERAKDELDERIDWHPK